MSPVGEPSPKTPNTEISISPMRRDSYTPSANPDSRAVSPVAIRRALSPLSRLRDLSPATTRNSIGHDPVKPPVKQPQQIASLRDLNLPPSQQPTPRHQKRRSLPAKLQTYVPPSAPSEQQKPPSQQSPHLYEEIITLTPTQPAPVQSYRRSRQSAVAAPSIASSHHGKPSLDAVREDSNPAVYRPTNGSGLHDARKFGREQSGKTPSGRGGGGGGGAYFGQSVNRFDLIAHGIENAFVAMR